MSGALCLNLPDFLLVGNLGTGPDCRLQIANAAELANVWFALPVSTRDRLQEQGISRRDFERELYRAYYAGVERGNGLIGFLTDDPPAKRGRPRQQKKGA